MELLSTGFLLVTTAFLYCEAKSLSREIRWHEIDNNLIDSREEQRKIPLSVEYGGPNYFRYGQYPIRRRQPEEAIYESTNDTKNETIQVRETAFLEPNDTTTSDIPEETEETEGQEMEHFKEEIVVLPDNGDSENVTVEIHYSTTFTDPVIASTATEEENTLIEEEANVTEKEIPSTEEETTLTEEQTGKPPSPGCSGFLSCILPRIQQWVPWSTRRGKPCSRRVGGTRNVQKTEKVERVTDPDVEESSQQYVLNRSKPNLVRLHDENGEYRIHVPESVKYITFIGPDGSALKISGDAPDTTTPDTPAPDDPFQHDHISPFFGSGLRDSIRSAFGRVNSAVHSWVRPLRNHDHQLTFGTEDSEPFFQDSFAERFHRRASAFAERMHRIFSNAFSMF